MSINSYSRIGFSIAILIIGFASGCADVVVRKVPADGGDNIRGYRYYLPRPYVVVKKEFPVVGEEYFVTGTIDENGDLIQFNKVTYPSLGDMFPSGIPFESVLSIEPAAPAPAPSGPVGSANAATDAGVAATPAPAAPKFEADTATNFLQGSKADPAIVIPTTATATIAVKVAKDPAIEVTAGTGRVVLVPFKDGTPDTGSAVTIDETKTVTEKKTGVEGSYEATVSRSKLTPGAFYAIGWRATAKITSNPPNEQQPIDRVFYRTTADLSVQGTVPKPAEPKKDEPKKDNSAGTLTTASATTAGDPLTDPFVKLGNDLFDVLYLPDFSEQYAVESRAGLGVVNSQIGFENGWMVERAHVQIDNRELGKFVFENLSKALDLALSLVAPGAPQAKSAAEALKGQAAKAQTATDATKEALRTVVLRVKNVSFATPGIYPILKNIEQASKCNADPAQSYVLRSYRPFTVVAFNVRRQVQIELVSPRSDAGPKKNGALGDADFEAVQPAIVTGLEGSTFEVSVGGTAITFTVKSVAATRSTTDQNRVKVECTLDVAPNPTISVPPKVIETQLADHSKERLTGKTGKFLLDPVVKNADEIQAKFKP